MALVQAETLRLSIHEPRTAREANSGLRHTFVLLLALYRSTGFSSLRCRLAAMSLLTDLVNLNLSETMEKIIAEYIWLVLHLFIFFAFSPFFLLAVWVSFNRLLP